MDERRRNSENPRRTTRSGSSDDSVNFRRTRSSQSSANSRHTRSSESSEIQRRQIRNSEGSRSSRHSGSTRRDTAEIRRREIMTPEDLLDDDEEYIRRRQERMRRRRLEKERQQKRRRMMRYAAMAAMLVLVISLAAFGISRLFPDSKGSGSSQVTEEVKAETGTQVTTALSQPVMGASDIAKFSEQTTLSGWQSDSSGIWYKNADGTFYQNGWQEIDGNQYYFNENGYVMTGWQIIDGEDCYFDESGKYDSQRVKPMIALTFDDGPGQYTEELLNCLEENNGKATFFMLGQNAEQYPDVVKRMKDMGMELANHTYDHQILTSLSNDQIANEINKTTSIIEKAAGASPTAMRPPGGAYNGTVQSISNLPIIIWSIDTKDWKTKSEEQTYQCVMDNAQDGSVVLMHDIHEWSVKAAIRMIPELTAKGFKLVTVEELAQAKGVTLENGKAYYYFGEGTQQVE